MKTEQDELDKLIAGWRKERSLTQMTLGGLIIRLEQFPKDRKIQRLYSPHSYRGYYEDLAFELSENDATVSELTDLLRNECLGETFEGYKGGLFTMKEDAPLWIAEWGCCGSKIIDIQEGDVLTFLKEEEDY